MIFAAILAGGKGTRVGTNVPKQFLEFGGKPIYYSDSRCFFGIRTLRFYLYFGK